MIRSSDFDDDDLTQLAKCRNLSGLDVSGARKVTVRALRSLSALPGTTATNFTYDAIYELLTAKQGSTTTESYTYDPVGNRLSNLAGSGWSNNSSNELTSRPGVTYNQSRVLRIVLEDFDWHRLTGLLWFTGYETPPQFEIPVWQTASMISRKLNSLLVGGRLAIDFANSAESDWAGFIRFLEDSRVVSPERSAQLLPLSHSDPQAADQLLSRVTRLRDALRRIFRALVHREKVSREWVAPVNEILRITEGHDELVWENAQWRLEFLARESGSEWLLATIARSAAEILVEGPAARLRLCANPACGLFFSDLSRTRRRRWCSMARCGNRHKVAAFARRRASRRGEL